MPAFRDLTGMTFGRLTVLCRAPNNKFGQVCWHVRCLCKAEKIVSGSALVKVKGATLSCGCLGREQRMQAITKHGHARNGKTSPEYRVWHEMIQRCHNPNNSGYQWYGARGIAVCDRWRCGKGGKTGFECFLADMGSRPSDKHSIDRWPNNDGHYAPGNCRWATRREQNNNTRRCHRIPMDDGRILTIAEVA